MKEWIIHIFQLVPVYPIVFIDAVHFSVRDDGVMFLCMNEDGMKEVLFSSYLKNLDGHSFRWFDRYQGCGISCIVHMAKHVLQIRI